VADGLGVAVAGEAVGVADGRDGLALGDGRDGLTCGVGVGAGGGGEVARGREVGEAAGCGDGETTVAALGGRTSR
jgi:hypothetical protein